MFLITKFENFLGAVDLNAYREKYNPIKLVEMNLPKKIQAIKMLYFFYWDFKKFVDYDNFYKAYLQANKDEIEAFRQKITMCEDCYYRGLPARIYRTWASLITQIHAGYVAESVFGEESVEMSAELDSQGVDFRVKYKNRILNYQVKKETQSTEVRKERKVKKKVEGESINISYTVPNFDRIKNPYRKDGKGFYKDYLDFKENFLDPGLLRIFDNGFVVFTPHAFEEKKREIDNELN